jgi:hypothetical protein
MPKRARQKGNYGRVTVTAPSASVAQPLAFPFTGMRGKEAMRTGSLEKKMWVDVIGYAGTAVFLVSYAMNGIIKLRTIGLFASAILLTFGVLKGSYPVIVEELLLIPIDLYGLYKMIRLIRQSKEAVEVNRTMEWLKPFSIKISCEPGATLFRLGDPAKEMFCIVSGAFLLVESGIALKPGDIVGELGWLSPGNLRTQTLRCEEGGQLLRISYDKLKELYFQNPRFGIYLLRLVSDRMFSNAATASQTYTLASGASGA